MNLLPITFVAATIQTPADYRRALRAAARAARRAARIASGKHVD